MHSTALGSVTVALVVALTGANERMVSAQGPATAQGGPAGGMHLLSPAVVSTWTAHRNDDGTTTKLLVLWRGSPGWLSRGPRGHGFGGGGFDGYWLSSANGTTFTVEFDFAGRTAVILGKLISLADTNVVLVDFADRSGGPAIAGHHRIDFPSVAQAIADPVPTIVQQTPFLFEYLKCDVRLADRTMDAERLRLCSEVRPVSR
jgi:hypothetical protein